MSLQNFLEQLEEVLRAVLDEPERDARISGLGAVEGHARQAMSLALEAGQGVCAARALRLFVLAHAFRAGWKSDAGRQMARLARAFDLFNTGLDQAASEEDRRNIRLELAKGYALRGSLIQHWFEGRSQHGLAAAMSCFAASAAAFSDVGLHTDRVRQTINAGDCAFSLGRLGRNEALATAEAAYGNALEHAARWDNPAETAQWRVKYASAAGEIAAGTRRERFDEAVSLFLEAVDEADRYNDPKNRISARLNFSGLLLQSRRTGWRDDLYLAIEHLSAAENLAHDLPDLRASAQLSLCAAWATTATGALTANIETAIDFGEAALAGFEALDETVDVARARQNLAEAYAMRIKGDRSENLLTARFLIGQAVKAVPRAAYPDLWSQFHTSAGRIEMFHAEGGDNRGWRRAARHLRLARAPGPGYGQSGVENLNLASVLLSLYGVSRNPADLTEGEACAEAAQAQFAATGDGEGERRAVVLRGRFAARKGDWEAAARRYEEGIIRSEGADVSGGSRTYPDTRYAGTGAEVSGLAAFAHVRCGRTGLGFERLMQGKARALARHLGLEPFALPLGLPPQTVVVAPLFDDAGCVVFVAGNDGRIDVIDIVGVDAESLTAVLFGSAAGRPAWVDHLESQDAKTLMACIEEAMAWLERHFTGRIGTCLSDRPGGGVMDILLVPFAGSSALPWHSAGGDTRLSARWHVRYAPTLASETPGAHSSSGAARDLLAVCDPTGTLDNAATECEEILRLAGGAGRIIGGPALDIEGIAGACQKAGHIHFATHGTFDPYDPRQAEIRLGGGRSLRAADIASRLRMDAHPVVTLAGCETGIADFAEREEERSGLGTAFLSAGAGVVVGALWKVPDLATTLLFTNFYARLFAGQAADRALTGASESLRKMSHEAARSRCQELRLDATEIDDATALSGNAGFPFSHPLFWGGFILMVSPLSTASDPAC